MTNFTKVINCYELVGLSENTTFVKMDPDSACIEVPLTPWSGRKTNNKIIFTVGSFSISHRAPNPVSYPEFLEFS